MWPARSALRPVPAHAVVPEEAMVETEADLSEGNDLETRITRCTEDMERAQPDLHRFLASELAGVTDETAQALGEFLSVAVLHAFVRAFGPRVRVVPEAVLASARMSFEWDEDLRRSDANEAMESDDLVAIGQPHVVAFVRDQIEAALEPDEDGEPADVDLDAVARVYHAMLIEVLALGQCVNPPRGVTVTEVLA